LPAKILKNWPMDERATLTNMAVEAGGTTGIIEPDEVTLDYIVRTRGLDAEEVRKGFTLQRSGCRVRGCV
jgi:homoaconitase/3-isopropylmalate dehydratase large subunit